MTNNIVFTYICTLNGKVNSAVRALFIRVALNIVICFMLLILFHSPFVVRKTGVILSGFGHRDSWVGGGGATWKRFSEIHIVDLSAGQGGRPYK